MDEKAPSKYIVVSIDKDMNQVPGWHYNFDKKVTFFVSPEQGLKHFYSQLLIGDTSDHIQGAPKIGPARAAKLLDGLVTENDLFLGVFNGYVAAYQKLGIHDSDFIIDQILQNGRCLKIRTYEGEVWNFPKLPPTVATEQSSTPQTQGETNPSMVLGSAN